MTWKTVYRRYLRIGRSKAAQGQRRGLISVTLRGVLRAGMAGLAFATGRRTAAARHGIHLAMRVGTLDYTFNRKKD